MRRRAGRSRPSSYGTPPQSWVLFLLVAHIRQHLVAADVERAERHRAIAGGIEHRAVERELLGRAREGRGHHELQLGAEQADAGGAGFFDVREINRESGIEQQCHRHAVLGDARPVAQREVLQLPARAQAHPLDIGLLHIGRRADVHVAGGAVDDDGVAGVGDAGGIGNLAHRRNAECARDDGDVRILAAFFQHQPAQALAVVFEQRRRSHAARHQHRILGQPVARRRIVLAEQLVHQPVGQFIEIVQALAQIGVGDAQHAGAGVGLHALGGSLGGQAGHDGFVQAVLPATVIGEHAVGFEHLAMLAGVGDLAALQQQVEVRAHGLDRSVEPLQFLLHVVGDEVGDDDARLVQHHVTERDALVDRDAGHVQRAPRRGFGAGPGDGGQLARGDHLRQHHGGGLQRLLFLLGIGAPRPVLHHQHAERVAGTQHRHAEEGVIDLFAGLRPVGEGGVRLCVGEIDRVGLARDQTDQALVGIEDRVVDGVRVEALGGVQLEPSVHA